MSAPRFPGVTLAVGDLSLVVPRLSLRQMQVLRDQLERIEANSGQGLVQQVEDVLDVVHAAVGRNHPDIERDALADLLDLGNVGPLLQAALSGKVAEGAPKGEAGPDSA